MSKLKAVLIDLNGTLHIENELIPGSIEALNKLRNSGLFQIKFVTNTTKESKAYLFNLLNSLGLKIELNEIYTSLTAARKLIEEKSLRPMLFLEPGALEDFHGLHVSNPNAVVIGLAPNMFDYENLNQAFRLVLNGAKLIGIHKARYYKRKDGLALGPGAFISGLEYSANVKADLVGKPNAEFFLSSIAEFNINPEECVMIGDDAIDDVEGAQNCGMRGILVKTGKYRDGDEEKLNKKPVFVAKNFSQAVDFILENYGL